MLQYEVAQQKRAIKVAPYNTFCGDSTLVLDQEKTVYLALFDGAGHGVLAYKVAKMATEYLSEQVHQPVCDTIVSLHEKLLGTCGGVVGVCRVEKKTGELQCAGVGDVSMHVYGQNARELISRSGVLGHEIMKPVLHKTTLVPGDVLMLFSDGISRRFKPAEIPNFYTKSSDNLTGEIIEKYGKDNDDASVIVLKVKND